MTSKLPQDKNSKENSQIMFQICVPDQKVKKNNQHYVFEFFKNAMIRNVKIHNILDTL